MAPRISLSYPLYISKASLRVLCLNILYDGIAILYLLDGNNSYIVLGTSGDVVNRYSPLAILIQCNYSIDPSVRILYDGNAILY